MKKNSLIVYSSDESSNSTKKHFFLFIANNKKANEGKSAFDDAGNKEQMNVFVWQMQGLKRFHENNFCFV
jgi:hypothetical protein